MAPRRKKKRTLKPRLPARVRTKRRKGKPKNQQHPELMGLGLVALGVFLASILYLGWSGGMVGGWIADGFTAAIGSAAYVAPVAFVVVGSLMVARSALVDVSPFRTGLVVTAFGLLAALGTHHGGAVGRGLEGMFGLLVGSTGTTIIGVLALIIGSLLLSGASAGALVRRSGHAVRR
ncbi:MAG: segregation ATPase FtsK/SpoIIIE, family, partial [Gaiellaceae bacterium]|nr:segregation ATPase FtsK/SpoIIIE, family [Gaiellaceae bacterium]